MKFSIIECRNECVVKDISSLYIFESISPQLQTFPYKVSPYILLSPVMNKASFESSPLVSNQSVTASLLLSSSIGQYSFPLFATTLFIIFCSLVSGLFNCHTSFLRAPVSYNTHNKAFSCILPCFSSSSEDRKSV